MTTPWLVSWNLTRRCNLACGHCYLDAGQRNGPDGNGLATEDALRIVDDLATSAPGAMVILTGGEPLLRKDLETLVATCAARGLTPVIGSNGTILDEARARSLAAAGARGVGISVDSAAPDFHDSLRGRSGAWLGALDGIAAARVAGLPVLMQAALFEQNRQEIGRIADLARDLGATALNFFFLVCTGRGATQTDISPASYELALREIVVLQDKHPDIVIRARCAPYVRRLMGLRAGEGKGAFADFSSACLAGRSYLRITPEGGVTPCPYIPLVIGSIREKSLAAILAKAPEIRRLRDEPPSGKCGRCEFALSCGGCRARALAACGDLMAEDPKCAYAPAPNAIPEMAPVRSPGAGVSWRADAEARLANIPVFVRARVRKRLEEKAAEEGLAEITPEFMFRNRPPWLARGELPPAFPPDTRPRGAR
jgi:radical SAM protein with 4Fe4S-binding SPASM domain